MPSLSTSILPTADVKAKIGTSEPIPIESFEHGLRRSYELSGMPPERIDYEVESAISDTVINTDYRFDATAENPH